MTFKRGTREGNREEETRKGAGGVTRAKRNGDPVLGSGLLFRWKATPTVVVGSSGRVSEATYKNRSRQAKREFPRVRAEGKTASA